MASTSQSENGGLFRCFETVRSRKVPGSFQGSTLTSYSPFPTDIPRIQILDIDPREVGPKMELEPKKNGQRMLYSVQYWVKDWTEQYLLINFEKIRDVLPNEKL